MKRGKNINLFLMDGNPSGRIKCTLVNWIGIAYKIPRTELDECKNREDLKQSGVYFLFGNNEETEDKVVYIGQASSRKNGEGILNRLYEHRRNKEKDYWTEAIALTTANNSLGLTEISYLENKFCELAIKSKRYLVKNGNYPSIGNITEEKESELEDFIDNAKIIIETLGHKIFTPLSNIKNDDSNYNTFNSKNLLYLNYKSIKATCLQTSDGFVLLKGSEISPKTINSCPEYVLKNRQKHSQKIDKNFILLEDILFTSPSAASSFVCGASSNGNTLWTTANGIKLKDLE